MERRTFITAAIAAPLLTTGVRASTPELSVTERIRHHMQAIERLLQESPLDTRNTYNGNFFVIGDKLIAHAHLKNYDGSQPYADFNLDSAEWEITAKK